MEQELLRGIATVFCMLGFAAVVYWAYTPVNKDRFEQDARLAFSWESDDDKPSGRTKVSRLDTCLSSNEEASK